MRIAYCSTIRSNQPHRRGRPVTAPYSFPRSRTSVASRSGISVGKGPLPTRVVYALVTPATALIGVGPTPRPVQAPPQIEFDDVTYGYVPKSMSCLVPCAPSNKTQSPPSTPPFHTTDSP